MHRKYGQYTIACTALPLFVIAMFLVWFVEQGKLKTAFLVQRAALSTSRGKR